MPHARRRAEGPRASWLGILGVAVTTAPLLQQIALHPERELPQHLWPWLLCVAVFLAADQWATRTARAATRIALLLGASLTACTAIWLIPVIYGGAALTATLLVVVAARLHQYSRPIAYTWITIQSIVLLSIYAARWNAEIGGAATFGFFCFQIIGFRFAHIASSEQGARIELKRALDALSITRNELTEAARRAERNQIAADLHDVLGHHLVALQLQLEAADSSTKHLSQARQLVRMLLAEVRGVVDELQDRQPFDLVPALTHLTNEDTSPKVSLDVVEGSGLRKLSATAAKECFRAIQEAVTNARKHAEADNVYIRVDSETLSIRDNGRSWAGPATGRGMAGMANRCRAAGCSFTLERERNVGTRILIGLPQPAAPGADW